MNHQFFESVLASTGRCCIALISGSTVKHRFSEYLGDLLEIAEEADKHGTNAYFALATFGADDSRTAANAQHLRALFLDIDCGDGKAYATLQDGATALTEFVEATKLPEPIVVISGGGLHVYWPFTKDLAVDQWKPLASALKSLCRAKGLQADPAVTSDAARILRIPGTHNHKPSFDAPPLVNIVHAGAGPTDPDVLRDLLPVIELAPDLSAAKAYASMDATTKALAGGDKPPSKFMRIVRMSLAEGGKGCGQIKNAVVNAATLSEPEWRAALSIAWNCVDAEKSIHKLSAPHPGYTPEDTLTKAERLTGKPHTCAWYKDNYPSACDGCKHKITSPIQLGAFVEEAKTDGDAYLVQSSIDRADDTQEVLEVAIPKYPYPYFRGADGGVFKYVVSEDDEAGAEKQIEEVYAHDLYVTGRFYDTDEHGDGDGELIGVNLQLPHDSLRQFSIPMTSVTAPDRLRDVLSKHGVLCVGKQIYALMSYLASSIKKLQGSMSSARTRSQMGWTPEMHFVLGDVEYTPTGPRLAPPASGTRQLAAHFQQKGTLEEWKEIVNFYNRPGLERHAFAFLIGVSSPLLKLLNSSQVRGAVVNLVSNESGTGKSTVQKVINSMYGHPTELLMEARDTVAARYHRLGVLNSLCMTIDEMTNATSEILSPMIYGSTSGRGAHRMESQGNKLRANNTSWCSVTMTSSNSVMADVMLNDKSALDGELRRIIDLRISTPTDQSKEFTDKLFGALEKCFGVAGPIFVQYLVTNREAVQDYLRAMQIRIDREVNFARGDRYYSAICAIAFTGAHIGNELGLWNYDIPRIYQHALEAVVDVRDSNAESVGNSQSMAVEALSKYLADNLGGALIIDTKGPDGVYLPAPQTVLRGALKYRYEPMVRELIIPAADFKHYLVTRRIDVKTALSSLRAEGLLTPNAQGDITTVRRPLAGVVGSMGAPVTRCYVFDTTKLGNMPLPSAADVSTAAASAEATDDGAAT